jgi:hypothetical protein
MVGQSPIVRIACFALVAAIATYATPSDARMRPGRPDAKTSPNLTVNPLGETEWVCGTYKGNESEMKTRQALHLRNQSQVKQGLKAQSAAGLDYVYDNVWVIEDDGSLSISGTNAYDTGAATFKVTNNGGGVHTMNTQPFSYDATLGTLLATGDDGAVLVTLPFSFPYGGSSYTQMYVSGNGAVSFGAVMNPNGFYDNADFFSATPKIAPYYLDLDETAGGDIRVLGDATHYTVSWISVQEYGNPASNTFQLTLYPSGSFYITYNGIGSNVPANGAPIIAGYNPGGSAALEEISLSTSLPHVSAAGAAVYEQYYSFPNPVVDEVALYNRFYTEFPDDFFQVIYFCNFNEEMSGAFAYERNIKNDVTGLGQGIFDGSAQYGSTTGKLESLCNMGPLNQWSSSDPAARVYGKGNNFLTIMGQESGHRWGAFVHFNAGFGVSNLLLGRADAHWSYYADIDHSSLEGGDWVNTGGNNYTCPTTIDYYSELDEYLFGLRTPNEVKDFYYISSASNNTVSARSQGTPLMGSSASGINVPVTVQNVIAAEGARTPVEADEQHDLRQGFIFLIQKGTVPTQAQLDKISAFRRAWEPYFEKSCDGRLSCNTSLTSTYAVGVIDGEVRDKYSQHTIPNFTARSIERSFSQHVPADGRFIFRYDDGPTQGSSEPVTLIFSAPGYLPDTLNTSITYGNTRHLVGLTDGIWLKPIATGAGDSPALTVLRANHPNPFNPTTTIEYTLGMADRVQIHVYDAAGHLVRTLVDRLEGKGEHHVNFDGRDDHGQPLSSGVYLYRLDASGVTQTRKMVLLK